MKCLLVLSCFFISFAPSYGAQKTEQLITKNFCDQALDTIRNPYYQQSQKLEHNFAITALAVNKGRIFFADKDQNVVCLVPNSTGSYTKKRIFTTNATSLRNIFIWDDSIISIGSNKKNIRLTDIETGRFSERKIGEHDITCLALSCLYHTDILLIGTQKGSVATYDLRIEKAIEKYTHNSAIDGIAVSADEIFFYAGNELISCHFATGNKLRSKSFSGKPKCLNVQNSSLFLNVNYAIEYFSIKDTKSFDTETMQSNGGWQINTLTRGNGILFSAEDKCIGYCQDPKILKSAIKLFNVRNRTFIDALKVHAPVNVMAFEGNTLYAGHTDGAITLWQPQHEITTNNNMVCEND